MENSTCHQWAFRRKQAWLLRSRKRRFHMDQPDCSEAKWLCCHLLLTSRPDGSWLLSTAIWPETGLERGSTFLKVVFTPLIQNPLATVTPRASKMAQQVKCSLYKPGNLSLIPRTHDRKNQFHPQSCLLTSTLPAFRIKNLLINTSELQDHCHHQFKSDLEKFRRMNKKIDGLTMQTRLAWSSTCLFQVLGGVHQGCLAQTPCS